MTWKNSADRWGPVSQLLHWLIVILILVHLLWMRFLEGLLPLWVATVLCLALAVFIIRKG